MGPGIPESKKEKQVVTGIKAVMEVIHRYEAMRDDLPYEMTEW
jgi:hypothetical protein